MEHASPQAPLTYQEFLDFVADKEGRYEYVDGRAIAMGTPSNAHQDISLVLGAALYQHLQGQRCKARLAVPLQTVSHGLTRERSPDLIVTCDEQDLAPGTRLNRRPKFIVEILSPNEGDDLQEKLDEYEAIAAVEEYIVIDSTKRSLGSFSSTHTTFRVQCASPRSATRSLSMRCTTRSALHSGAGNSLTAAIAATYPQS
jgi:Uma2 family endonuclease